MRVRSFPKHNYKAIFTPENGNTIRLSPERSRETTELAWPEFYDVALNTKCRTGQSLLKQKDGSWSNCYYCYASASLNGEYFPDVTQRVLEFFGKMTENQRPFQVAIGGSGEPLEHPEFWDVCKAFQTLGIVPNYTTNGILVRDDTVEKTKQLCGGVAVTCHPHMDAFWRRALARLASGGVRVNTHHIISDRQSIEAFAKIYEEEKEKVDYFVLLPYMNVGLAAENPRDIDYQFLEETLDPIHGEGKLAFGANFYPWLLGMGKYEVSMYPPERFSKYAMMDKEGVPSLYNNSFEMKPVDFSWENGVITEQTALIDLGLKLQEGEVQWDVTSTRSLHAVDEKGKIAGFIDLMPLATGEVGIGQITVRRKYQRKGVATTLFKMAQKLEPKLVLHSYDWSDEGVKWAEHVQSL